MRRRNHVLSSAEDRFAAKQVPRFVGPAKVVQVYSSVVYLVEDLDSKRRTKVFVNDLKKYTPPRGTQQLEAQATATDIVVSDSRDVVRGHTAPSNRASSPPPNSATAGPAARKRGRPARISPPAGVPAAGAPPVAARQGADASRRMPVRRGSSAMEGGSTRAPPQSPAPQLVFCPTLAPIGQPPTTPGGRSTTANKGMPEYGEGRYFRPSTPSSESEPVWVDPPAE